LSDATSPSKATPAVAFCFLLNQLLDREGWARERLARVAGQALELRLPLLAPLRVCVAPDGRMAPGGAEPSALVMLSGIGGSGPLAEELRYLARHLRPEVEEPLSRVVGDIATQRIGDGLRALARWQRDAALRAGEAFADYVIDERRMLVRRTEFAPLAAEIARLASALGDLEQRIARLD
jgi:ubiquinone biosynthesis accessory factor UbiJ